MPYERMTVDVEELFVLILSDALGDFAEAYGQSTMEVMGQQDFDSIAHVPFVVVNALNGRMLDGPNAWEWDITVSLVHLSRDQAADFADMVYRAFHESHDNNASYPGVGAVTSVDDRSMPSRTSTTVTPAGDLTQYDGMFHVIVRKI